MIIRIDVRRRVGMRGIIQYHLQIPDKDLADPEFCYYPLAPWPQVEWQPDDLMASR
jgi:hypothetical protein